MRYPLIPDDLPGSRHSIESVATKFKIYAMFTLAMMSGAIFLLGLVLSHDKIDAALESFPEPLVYVCVGLAGFSLFFPIFMALYYARHLLISVKRLEAQNAELRHQIAAIAERIALPAAAVDGLAPRP